jgi:hypothetical protein
MQYLRKNSPYIQDDMVASSSSRSTTGENNPNIHRAEGATSAITDIDVVILSCWESNPCALARNP